MLGLAHAFGPIPVELHGHHHGSLEWTPLLCFAYLHNMHDIRQRKEASNRRKIDQIGTFMHVPVLGTCRSNDLNCHCWLPLPNNEQVLNLQWRVDAKHWLPDHSSGHVTEVTVSIDYP